MLYAVYGNNLSYYGNIQLGAAPRFIQNYGGWPEQHPNIQDILPEKESESYLGEPVLSTAFDAEIAANIAIIKQLRAELEIAEDLELRRAIRKRIEEIRRQKDRYFQIKARTDEEESAFILLH